MAADILKSIIEELQYVDVDNLKYILRGSFTGKFYITFNLLTLKLRYACKYLFTYFFTENYDIL